LIDAIGGAWDTRRRAFGMTRAGLKPIQLHWAPRHGVWQVVHFVRYSLRSRIQ